MLIFEIFLLKFSHITAPVRFGKSTNLDMVKRFIEIDVDDNGERKDINTTENYKLFKNNNLNIFKLQDFVNKHFGKYPVVYIDFSDFSEITNLDSVVSKFRTLVRRTFVKHRYLLKNSTLFVNNTESKDLFMKYCEGNVAMSTVEEFRKALKLLTKYLTKRFNKSAFVLIDEYDSHVKSLLFKDCPDLDKMLTFIHSIFEEVVFNNDDYVFGAVLTGVFRVSLLYTLSDYHHFSFLQDNDFSQFYGITDSELDKLLTVSGRNDNETKSRILDFYNGYTIIGQDVQIYSIWSILNYLNNLEIRKEVKTYWCTNDCFDFLKSMFSLKGISRMIKKLLLPATLWINVDKPIYKENIIKLNEALGNVQSSVDPNLGQLSINLLYHYGFLSVVTNTNTTVRNKETHVRIPNKEISVTLQKALAEDVE